MKLKSLAPLLALALGVFLSGCAPHTQPEPSLSPPAVSQPPAEETPAQSSAASPEETGSAATLYIGTRAQGFEEYPICYDGELTPELLIQSIADLTGWDLTLGAEVFSGRGGMSVCLSGQSSLFQGPPDPQKEEFFVYDSYQLARTILDSIQKTLQMGFTGPLGTPDALDIYFYMEGEQPLELPELELSWPLDQPYMWPEE